MERSYSPNLMAIVWVEKRRLFNGGCLDQVNWIHNRLEASKPL